MLFASGKHQVTWSKGYVLVSFPKADAAIAFKDNGVRWGFCRELDGATVAIAIVDFEFWCRCWR